MAPATTTPAAWLRLGLLLALLSLAHASRSGAVFGKSEAVKAARARQLLADEAENTVDAAASAVVRLRWVISLATVAPDCFERPALLVNGQLSPTIEVTQGNILELTIINDVPDSYPAIQPGITIHFHGFRMKGQPWYDGTGYTELCPVMHGKRMTIKFQVNEIPGTYVWHGHNGADRVDGLVGALIVRPRGPPVVPVKVDGERTLVFFDWWHTQGSALGMSLNQPFDAALKNSESGGWNWVNNPQAILINGRGYYKDCDIPAGGNTTLPTCAVSQFWVPPGRSALNPTASAVNPGCAHTNITVEAGKRYLFRLISATSLVYQTVCFPGHKLDIVAADAIPVKPIRAPGGGSCVDLNSGQRLDVVLRADQPLGNYWITSQVQFRNGSPNGYAVLRYRGAPKALPQAPTPQPGAVAPWTPQQYAELVVDPRLLGNKNKSVAGGVYRTAMSRVPKPDLRLTLNITQPLMPETGQLRWAINNVAHQQPTPCQPLLDLVWNNSNWIEQNVVPASRYDKNGFNASTLGVQAAQSGVVDVFIAGVDDSKNPPPIYPTAGINILPLKRGEVLEVVLQNLNANANNGDYTGANRTAQEQHPFHLHGHSFWLLGTGLGVYDPSTMASQLNTANPPLRDTVTLPSGGWAVFRFKGDNPGMWIFHCHYFWHEWMGQALVVAEDVAAIPGIKRPKGLPACPSTCVYNAAPWNTSTVQQQYGDSGFQLPVNAAAG